MADTFLRPAEAGVSAEGARTVTITDLLRVPIRRWPVLVAGVLLGVGAVVGYLSLVSPTYTAVTEVALRLPVTNTFSYPGAGADRVINMNVEASLSTSAEVVEEVAKATGRPTPAVREGLAVETPVGGQKLRFTYVAPTASEAVLGADTAATAYLDLRRELYTLQREGRVADYEQSIAEVSDDLAELQQRIANLPPSDGSVQSPGATAALAELTALRTELAQLRELRNEIRSVDVTPGWVTRPADTTPPSSHDRGKLLLLAGAFGGGLLGGVGALGAESLHRRVRTTADVTHLTGLPLLGRVRRRRRWTPVAATDADIHYISLALAAQLPAGDSLVVVVSTRPDEGRTRLVAGLAVALAARGQEVYVASMAGQLEELRECVLADRRRVAAPSVLAVATGSASPLAEPAGLARVNGTSGDSAADRPSVDDLATVAPQLTDHPTAGVAKGRVALAEARLRLESEETSPEPAPAVVSRPRVTDAVPVGSGTVRIGPSGTDPGAALVLVDAPAAELSAQGVEVARDGFAVVVAACDRTRLVELHRLVERLAGVGSRPIGVIVTES